MFRQAPLGISQYSPSRPMPSMDDQKYGPGLFRDKILKIEELKRLMSKHSQYHENPDGLIRLAVYNSINGDNTLRGKYILNAGKRPRNIFCLDIEDDL